MPTKFAAPFAAFIFACLVSGCGYLDDDLFVDDDTFASGFGSGSIGLSGRGFSSSCGGVGHLRRRVPRRAVGAHGSVSLGELWMTKPLNQMSDEELLEHTDVGVVEESTKPGAARGTARYVYESQLQQRNQDVMGIFASDEPLIIY